MSKKAKKVTARNASELARLLRLQPEVGAEMDFRAQLNLKIVTVVRKKQLTHVEVAKKARTSRTRITAILNGNTSGVSTDLLLKILYALGYKTKATFSPTKIAA